jgi:SAM-dependent methyltransferase
MQIVKLARAAVRRVLGPELVRDMRRRFHRKLPDLQAYRTFLSGRRGLEIGGPSGILSDDGPLPIYDVLASLDNCLYSESTIWTGSVSEGETFHYHPSKPPGAQIICDATDLGSIKDRSYEVVLASHCLEHVANPLKALAEWNRVLRNNGALLLILPHKDGTFDWRRPTTTLDHMIEDYAKQTTEDDLTHLDEILALHDLQKDWKAGSPQKFRERCLENRVNRAMHHHVFDTGSAISVVDYAGLRIIRADTFPPYHIMILAVRSDGTPNNSGFMGAGAPHKNRSPFPSDSGRIDRNC